MGAASLPLLIFNLAIWPAAADMRSQVSFWPPNGVVGGDDTSEEELFGLPLLDTDMLPSPFSVDSGDPQLF